MKNKLLFCLSMVIFGTIGLVRRYIPLSSSVIAFARALIGTIVLAIYISLTKKKMDLASIQKNSHYIIPSGILLGFNWILLFESYQYTTVAIGTLCYYMAPVIVILTSPFFLKEKLTLKKVSFLMIALIGMVFVSDLLDSPLQGSSLKGILYGLASALFYSGIMICNKKIKNVSAYDKTIIQLLVSTIILIPYIYLTEDISTITITQNTLIYLLIAGIIHTGLAYVCYFGSLSELPGQSIGLMSYLDPVIAIIISITFLNEPIHLLQMIGAFFILGSTLLNELTDH